MIEQIVRADSSGELLFLGAAGETLRHKIVFDCAPLVEEFHGGVAELLVKPPNSEELYPPATTQHDRLLEWVITNNDTAVGGRGRAELRWYGMDGELAKSVTFLTTVRKSLTNEGAVPDYYKGWVDSVVEVGARAKQDANTAQSSAEAAAESQSGAANSAQSAAQSAASARQSKEASAASERNTQALTEEVRESLEAVTQAKNEIGTLAEGVRRDKNDVDVAHDYVMDAANELYDGVDLTEVFADEIASFHSVWAWMQDRINRGDFSGFHVCDYIPMQIGPYYSGRKMASMEEGDTLDAIYTTEEVKCRIAGIDVDRGWLTPKHHIDFVSDENLLAMNGVGFWRSSRMNLIPYYNGIPDGTGSAWLDSNLYLWLNSKRGNVIESAECDEETKVLTRTVTEVDYTETGLYNALPEALKQVITEKKAYLPLQYDPEKLVESAELAMSRFAKIGKLWLPSEYEVLGEPHVAANSAECGGRQYPLWKNSRYRVKDFGTHWCTRSPAFFCSDKCVAIRSKRGTPFRLEPDEIAYYPICFRIQEGGEEPDVPEIEEDVEEVQEGEA